jgi:hypothetical protein
LFHSNPLKHLLGQSREAVFPHNSFLEIEETIQQDQNLARLIQADNALKRRTL